MFRLKVAFKQIPKIIALTYYTIDHYISTFNSSYNSVSLIARRPSYLLMGRSLITSFFINSVDKTNMRDTKLLLVRALKIAFFQNFYLCN